MPHPLVSIIIPVYQVSEYIERCIRSVMNQTYQNIECIIVDDCGKDDSMAKCERMIQTYNGPIDFIILHHEENRGISAARNTGIKNATGDYLFFIDSDDELPKRSIEILLDVAMEDDAIEMVYGNTLFQPVRSPNPWDNSRQKVPSSLTSNEDIRYYFFRKRQLYIFAHNKLLKRSFVLQNNLYFKEGIWSEDQLWSFFLYKSLNNMRLVSEYTYYYHIVPTSYCRKSSLETKAQNKGIVIQNILMHLTPSKEEEEMVRYVKYLYFTFHCLRYLRKVPDYWLAFSMFWKQARKHRCWGIMLDLALIYLSSYFRNGEDVYNKLNKVKNRLFSLIKNKTINT